MSHILLSVRANNKDLRKWSTQATSFRPNPFHATYFLNVYNLSSIHLNKILFKPIIKIWILNNKDLDPTTKVRFLSFARTAMITATL